MCLEGLRCKKGSCLQREMDALHTHTDTQTLTYTNTHMHKHTDNRSHGGEPAEHTHTPAWVNCYWVLFYVTISQVRKRRKFIWTGKEEMCDEGKWTKRERENVWGELRNSHWLVWPTAPHWLKCLPDKLLWPAACSANSMKQYLVV